MILSRRAFTEIKRQAQKALSKKWVKKASLLQLCLRTQEGLIKSSE